MSHSLPMPGSPQRDLFEIEDLVAIATGKAPVICLQQAKLSAQRTIRRNPAIRRVVFIVLRANDELQLVSIGARGGHRVEWIFGPVPQGVN